jgi:hypothetical protein
LPQIKKQAACFDTTCLSLVMFRFPARNCTFCVDWIDHDLDRFIRALFSMDAVATLIDRFTSGVQNSTGYEVTNL